MADADTLTTGTATPHPSFSFRYTIHSSKQKPMFFQITKIEFDFEMEDDVFPSQEYQEYVTQKTLNKVWDAISEEDLVDVISDETGWCVKYVDYVVV